MIKTDNIHGHKPQKNLVKEFPDRSQFIIDLSRGLMTCRHCNRSAAVPKDVPYVSPQMNDFRKMFKAEHDHTEEKHIEKLLEKRIKKYHDTGRDDA